MAYAYKTVRYNVHSKTPDELPLVQLHGFLLPAFSVVLIREAYRTILYFLDTVIVYGNAMRVAADKPYTSFQL
jgi:hypothetical protein